MRASDLFRCTVVTADGTELGRVRDARVVQDGPIRQGVQAALRVEALVVGSGAVGERLGYIRAEVRGPWLLRVLLTRLERRANVVDVHDVAEWDEDASRIVLRPGARIVPLG